MAHTTSPAHWVGVFFLLVAACLLLVTTISAPVVHDIGLLKVTLTNSSNARHSSVTFGTFGHCVLDVAPAQTDQDYCTKKSIGYPVAKIMEAIDSTTYRGAAVHTPDGLTNAMILHPIACGIAFLAFLAALGTGICGSVLGAILAALAWIVTLVIMVIDFVLFGIVKDHVNGDGSGSHAVYSIAMWTCLAAMILLFFAQFIVFFSCFSNRRHARSTRHHKSSRDTGYSNEYVTRTRTRRRRFGLF